MLKGDNKNMSIILKIIQILMAMWTAFCITYHLLIFLLSVGPTDFQGNPDGLDEYILAALTLITVILQMIMLPKLIKKISSKVVLVLLGSAYLSWVASLMFYGGIDILLIPTIYAVPMILLYGGYRLISRTIPTHKQESS